MTNLRSTMRHSSARKHKLPAANSDNFHAACQRILSSLPIVKLHPETMAKTTKTLFPPRLPRHTPLKETNSQSSQTPGTRSRIQEQSSKSNLFRRMNSNNTLATLRKTERGTARHPNPTDPTRAMLLLDIVNMFNAVSGEACRLVLEKHEQFNALIPFFDILHSTNNMRWHRTPEGTFSTFSQAALFASLVLHELLTDLIKKIQNTPDKPLMPRGRQSGIPVTNKVSLGRHKRTSSMPRHLVVPRKICHIRRTTENRPELQQNSNPHVHNIRIAAGPCCSKMVAQTYDDHTF
jgi:hypothetical protein